MSGSDFSLKPSSLKAALCKIPTGPFLTPSHNPHSLSQRCHLFSPSEDHSTPLMTTASYSHHLSVFPRRTSRGTHDPTRLGLRRGSRFLAEALRRVPDRPQPVSPSLRLPAGHPAGCSRDGGGSARRPSPAPGNGRPTDPGAGTEQPPPSRLGRWAGGGAAPPRCGAGRGGSVRRCDAGGAGTPGGVAAVPPARPGPALPCPPLLGPEQGEYGEGSPTGLRTGTCRGNGFRRLLPVAVSLGAAGGCRLPSLPARPRGGKEAARQPGLRRWCPPGLKSARRKMASSPSLLPGGYLAMIIAFIRFCLPSSRTSSLARCPLGAGRMGRKTAASPPWFPASLPGCQVKIRAAHHRDPRAVPLVRVRCTLGISSC